MSCRQLRNSCQIEVGIEVNARLNRDRLLIFVQRGIIVERDANDGYAFEFAEFCQRQMLAV